MKAKQTSVQNAMTIDVEDWHQLAHRKMLGRVVPASSRVVADTELILELLAEHNVRATFFVVGAVAEQFPELVRRIHQQGHEVGTHGYAHRPMAQLDRDEFVADLRRSVRILENIVGEPVWGHRAAEFSINGGLSWVLGAMAAEGLRYDSSMFPIPHPRYGMPGAPRGPHVYNTASGPLTEFPLATLRLFRQNWPIAGGGYLRVLPLPLVRWGIDLLNRRGQMAVLYVHSYDFDKERLDLSVPTHSPLRWAQLRMRRIKRNWGHAEPMQAKFVELLRSYTFVPLREVLATHEGEG